MAYHFKKAIMTQYVPATNTRGARIKASAEGVGSIFVSYQYGSVYDEHVNAAKALAKKYGWTGTLVGGGRPDGRGYVFVFDDAEARVQNPMRRRRNPVESAVGNYSKYHKRSAWLRAAHRMGYTTLDDRGPKGKLTGDMKAVDPSHGFHRGQWNHEQQYGWLKHRGK